jgi:hypothetical protein
MDYKSGFTFIFADPNWFKKMFIAALVLLLSILIVPCLALVGYIVKSIRNAAEGMEHPLPEWTGWGELISTGFRMVLASLVYAIPFFIVILFVFSLAAMTPVFIDDNLEFIQIASIIFSAIAQLIVFIFNVIAYAFAPAIIMQFARTNSIRETIKPKNVISIIKMNTTDYVVICLLGVALQTMASFGIVAFLVGVFFTIVYAELVKAYLFGQYLRINLKNLNAQENAREQEDNAIDSCYNPSISSITD